MPNLDLRPPALNLLTYYKGDYTIRFEFTDGGSAYPLTDVTAASFIIYEKNGTAALTLSSGSGLTVNGASGYVDLALTNAQVVALYSQEYNFEFLLTLTGGTVWPIADGVFIVSEDGQTSVSLSDISLSVENSTVEISVIAPAMDLTPGHEIQDEGTPLTQRGALNFVGAGVTVTDDSGNDRTTVTISGGGGGGTWGSITGTLSDQTDLQTALDGKSDTGHTHPLADLTQSGATSGQVAKWNGSAWAPADEAGGADGNGIYSGSGTVDISGGDVEATLSNDSGGLKFKYADGTTGIEIINGPTAGDRYAQLTNGEGTAYVYAETNGATLEATGGLLVRVAAAGIEINGPSGTVSAGQVWTADGLGYGDFQDPAGGSAGVTEITYADMTTALSGGTLTPGGWYLITDATGTDLGFLTYAVTENQISVAGVGGYLNADFQAVGDYTGVEAITGIAAGTQQGIWQAANEGSYLQGDMVIWDLFHFQLIDSGAVDGTAPTNNTAAYTQLLKTDQGQGYIPAWDVSDYVFSVNNIYFRRDSALRHFVSGQVAVSTFQWGRDFVEAIEIFIGVVDIPNFRGYFASNRVSGYVNNIISTESGEIVNNTIFINSLIEEITLGDYSVMASNILKNGAIITTITAGGNCAISRNELGQGSTLGGGMTMGDDATINGNIILNDVSVSNKTFDAGVLFNGNTIGVTMDETETITDSITGKRAIPGFSDIPGTIDITGLTALDCTAAFAQYRGIYNLTSSNATEAIDTITNPPTAFPFTLRPAAGLVLTVTGTAYSGIAAGQIALKAASYVLDGDKGEYIVLEIDPLGTGALIEKYVVNGLI